MRIRNMTRCGLMTAAMTLCAWLSVPVGPLAVSLQTFGLFLALCMLGGRLGSVCVAVYLGLGAVGAPVFAGFQGGFAVLMGPTGGFLWGFLLTAILWWLVQRRLPRLPMMILGQLVCYLCGSLWFMYLTGAEIWAAVGVCVAPYIVADVAKLILAHLIASGLKKRRIWSE